jgi:membrane-bound lytic murein transglycosylase A
MIQAINRLLEIVAAHPAKPETRTQALKREFTLYRSVGRDNQGGVLMTGYYEPILEGARQPSKRFGQPLYATPSDLVTVDLKLFGDDLPKRRLVGQVNRNKLTPYPDREAIDHQGAIQGKAKVLAWIEDPVESFFLQIQGSGQVRFADGGRVRLGYAANNGRPYRPIGRVLMDEGLLTQDRKSVV